MALKVLMLRKHLEEAVNRSKKLEERTADFKKRETEAEKAVNEINEDTTEEEKEEIEKVVNELLEEKKKLEEEKEEIEKKIKELEEEIKKEEKEIEPGEGGSEPVENRKKFFGMNYEERSKFFNNAEVRTFLDEVRSKARETRAVKGSEFTIPTVILDLIRENVNNYSKLIDRVRLMTVSGTARQNVMGTIPEAIWTEMCASLNELEFRFNQVEVDGYKVGGIVYVCESTLEDSDIDLATEIITGLGMAIGIALDKAILYGTGKKMPLGIVTRLAQDKEPTDYLATAREWENLSTSNLITISSDKHGIDFYKEIVTAGGKAKSKYSRGVKFWAMNESTYTTLKVEAMSTNAAGMIVTATEGVMPVAAGDIIVLSDDIIPDNNIVGGYGDLYLLAERAAGSFKRSDEYRFAEDQVAFKGTARYDGLPVIAEGFVAIGIGSAPVKAVQFTADDANNATLTSLAVGTETLAPVFASDKYTYKITAAGTDGIVDAVATSSKAKIEIHYGDKKINNGSKIKFEETKDLTIKVKNGLTELTYTITIVKS